MTCKTCALLWTVLIIGAFVAFVYLCGNMLYAAGADSATKHDQAAKTAQIHYIAQDGAGFEFQSVVLVDNTHVEGFWTGGEPIGPFSEYFEQVNWEKQVARYTKVIGPAAEPELGDFYICQGLQCVDYSKVSTTTTKD